MTIEVIKSSPGTWQQEMRNAVRDPATLCKLLDLPKDWSENALQGAKQFPVFVPLSYLQRIRPADPTDPLLLQVLPLSAEAVPQEGFLQDPVGDLNATLEDGLIQKYHGRVLTILTGTCPIHCRYCFRRHFPYDQQHGLVAWQKIVERVEQDEGVHEVILSGGDPLATSDELLARLVDQLAQVPHLKRIRLHSRFPIAIPNRVTNELIEVLSSSRLQVTMVVHANHPNEFDRSVSEALKRFSQSGILTFNQSVLLKSVNDDADVLAALSENLIGCGVVPYYLHQLDRVTGAAHFEVPEHVGIQLIQELRNRLPGYAVPRYVRETPGHPAKTIIA